MKQFYVTMRRGRGTAWLAGPFDTYDQAVPHIPMARRLAEAADPKCAFDSFGVSSRDALDHPPGTLNKRLGL